MQAETQGRPENHMKNDLPPTPQFAKFAEGNVQVLTEVKKRDLCLCGGLQMSCVI